MKKLGPKARRMLQARVQDAFEKDAETRARAELLPGRLKAVRQAQQVFSRIPVSRNIDVDET